MNQAEIDVQMLHVEWAKKVGLVWVYVGINGLRMVDDADKKIRIFGISNHDFNF